MQLSLRDPSSPNCLSRVAGNGNLANFSTVELVSLPDSLSGFPRLCDAVPETLRHYLENIQSMIKSKAEESCKKNAALCTFAGDWSSSASSEGACEICSRNLLG